MSFRAATGVALCATLLLTEGCGGGQARPPHAAPASAAIRFEDLPVTRLERSRVPLPNSDNPSLGAPRAPVVVQLWSDFECPFCADMQPVLSELVRIYPGQVRLVWHDFPSPSHAHARLAASAGREVYAEGGATAFWSFHDALFSASVPSLDAEALEHFAVKAGVDAARFRAGLSSKRHEAEIAQDLALGDALHADGTPAFLVNDYFFVGAVPLEVLRVIVERALSERGS